MPQLRDRPPLALALVPEPRVQVHRQHQQPRHPRRHPRRHLRRRMPRAAARRVACLFCPECVPFLPQIIQSHSTHIQFIQEHSGCFRLHSGSLSYEKNAIHLHSDVTFTHITTSTYSACIHKSRFMRIQRHSAQTAFSCYFIRHHSVSTAFTIGHDPHSRAASYGTSRIQVHSQPFSINTFTLKPHSRTGDRPPTALPTFTQHFIQS